MMKLLAPAAAPLEPEAQRDFRREVEAGLSSYPKRIPAEFFYDDEGSRLFQKISREPDYYVTRVEFSILTRIASELPGYLGDEPAIDIVELGAGDGHKSRLVIDGFLERGREVHYYPIDISDQAMRLLGENLPRHAKLETLGLVTDYFSGLKHARSISRNRQLVLFLGSNIGNLSRRQSLEFLRTLRASLCPGDHALIGFDQKKCVDVLNRAYNDSSGYTRGFNLNLLTRINRELGGEFVLENFRHYGFYNPAQGAMESYLISREEQSVRIEQLGRAFRFGREEPLHLEYSFKFLPEDIDLLCEESGFYGVRQFLDPRAYFMDALWCVRPTE